MNRRKQDRIAQEGLQDYASPLEKLRKNPEPTDVFDEFKREKAKKAIVEALGKEATKKQRVAGKKALKTVTPKPKTTTLALKPLTALEQPFELTQRSDDELAAAQARQETAKLAELDTIEADRKARRQTVQEIQAATTMSDIQFGGFVQVPGSGMFMGSLLRGVGSGAGGVVGMFGELVKDASSALGLASGGIEQVGVREVQDYLLAMGTQIQEDARLTSELFAEAKPKEQQNFIERAGEFTGQFVASLPTLALGNAVAGPAVTFGLMKAYGKKAQGEKDPRKLAEEFAIGAVEGYVFQQLGKTSDWIKQAAKVETRTGEWFAGAVQLGVQGVAGVVQEGIDVVREPNRNSDWMDYLFSGATNVLLDPILLPGGSYKAQSAIEAGRASERFKGANLELPKIARPSDWVYDNVPVENATIRDLLEGAKIEFDEANSLLWVNPQAGVVLARAMEGLGGRTETTAGIMLRSDQVGQVVELLNEKARQARQGIEEMSEPTADARDLVGMAVKYESLAETLANVGDRELVVRFAGGKLQDETVVGHEFFHAEEQKMAERIGHDYLYSIHPPNFLVSHPLGAKLISNMGDWLEANYPDARTWTSEAMAVIAQPGEGQTGLSKQERGVLLGDYMAEIGQVHGVDVVKGFDARWVDRDVATTAFARMAERNLVELNRGWDGKPVGLVWKGMEAIKTRTGEGSWEGSEIVPRIVGESREVNKAIQLNELAWRLKDSKVRHKDGRLIRVHHGSPKGMEIAEVDLSKLNQNDWIKGFFTTQSARVASDYSKPGKGGFGTAAGTERGSNVHAFYLDIKNPLDLEASVSAELWKEVKQELDNVGRSESLESLPSDATGQEVVDALKQHFRENAYRLRNDKEYLEGEGPELTNPVIEFDPDGDAMLGMKTWVVKSDEYPYGIETFGETETQALRSATRQHRYLLVGGDYAIEQTRRVLLNAEYDGATHIGGGEREPRVFTDKVEAERYAEETGGEFHEKAVGLPDDPELKTAYQNYAKDADYHEGYSSWEGFLDALKFNKEYYPEVKEYTDIYNKAIELALPKTYEVAGHRVWIAFKPEQVVSATAFFPEGERYFTPERLTDYKERGWREHYGITQPLSNPALESTMDQIQTEAGMNALMEVLPIPKMAEELGDSVEAVPVEPPTEPDPVKNFKLSQDAYDLASRTLTKANREIRETASAMRLLRQLGESGTDTTAQLKAMQDRLLELREAKRVATENKVKLSTLLRDSWSNVADKLQESRRKKYMSMAGIKLKEFAENQLAAQSRVEQFSASVEANRAFLGEDRWQQLMKLSDFRIIADHGRDIMIAAGLKLLPRITVHKQLAAAVMGGFADHTKLDAALESVGLTRQRYIDAFLYAGSEAGRMLNVLSQTKKDLAKQIDLSPESIGANLGELERSLPEMALWLQNNTPTLKEIKGLVRGRNNISRFISLHDATQLLTVATQMTNVVMSGVAMVADGITTFLENVENRYIRNGTFDVELIDGTIETRELDYVPLSQSFRPLVETATLLGWVSKVKNAKWLDAGKVPQGRPEETVYKGVRILDNLVKAFPGIYSELLASMDADIESMDVVSLGQSLDVMERQLKLQPDSLTNRKKLAEIARQRTQLKIEGGPLATKLRAAEGVMHKAMIIGRGPERTVRTAAFVGKLYYHAGKRGQDLDVLLAEDRLHEVHPEAISKAIVDALKITYGEQPHFGHGRLGDAYANIIGWIRAAEDPVAIGVRIKQPYVNFAMQFLKQTYEWSPASLFRYTKVVPGIRAMWGAEAQAEVRANDGDFTRLNKMLVGSTAWLWAYALTKDKYDDVEETGEAPKHPDWDALGPVSVKGTPFGPMFFVADMIERKRRGLPMNVRNGFEALANMGADMRGATGVFDWADDFYEKFAKGGWGDGRSWKEKTEEELELEVGKWFAGFETPLRNFTDFYAQYDEDQRTLKDIYGWGYGSLVLPILDKLPSRIGRQEVREQMLDQIDVFTGRPLMRTAPAARALTGVNLVQEHSKLNNLLIARGVKTGDWIPFSGVKDVDRELSREVAKQMLPITEFYEQGGMQGQDIDAQMVTLIEGMKGVSAKALDTVLEKFPDVRLQMETNRELNQWEKRVKEKAMKAFDGTSYTDLYEQAKQFRLQKREMLKSNRGEDQ